ELRRSLGVQALRGAGGDGGRARGRAALRRQRLHGRVPGGAALPRREGAADLCGDGRDPGVADRAEFAGRVTTVTWRDFAAAEPELAAAGRSLLHQFGVGLAFLPTVPNDGAPRPDPVRPVLSGDQPILPVTSTPPTGNA